MSCNNIYKYNNIIDTKKLKKKHFICAIILIFISASKTLVNNKDNMELYM